MQKSKKTKGLRKERLENIKKGDERSKSIEENKNNLAKSALVSIEKNRKLLEEEAKTASEERRESIKTELGDLDNEMKPHKKITNDFGGVIEKINKNIEDGKKLIGEIDKELELVNAKLAEANQTIAQANAVNDLLDSDEATQNAVAGEVYASTNAVLLTDTHLRNVVQAHMPSLTAQPVLTASNGSVPVGASLHTPAARTWANAWGFDGKTSGKNAVNHKGSGLAVGGDVRVADHVALGAVLAVEDNKVNSDRIIKAQTKVKSYTLGSYTSIAAASNVSVAAGVFYSTLDFDSNRDMSAQNFGIAKASYQGHKVQAFAEVARAFEVGTAGTVAPYLNLTHTWLHTDAIREKGTALLPVEVRAKNDSALQSTLGVRAAYRLPMARPVSLTANLGWAHTFAKAAPKTTNRFVVAGVDSDSFTVQGQKMGKDRALIGVGVEAQVAKNATVALAYDGQFASGYQDHAGSVQFKLRF